MENAPAVLFDGLVLPDGADAVHRLASYGQTIEFITLQYRHGKPILALGASRELLRAAGIEDFHDGVLALAANDSSARERFFDALSRHRYPERERDPATV